MTSPTHGVAPDAKHRVVLGDTGRVHEVPDNANLRELFLRERVPLYRGFARVLNCEGKARCGTCRIRVEEGAENLSRPTPFERERLPDAPPDVRLACQANVRGDVGIARPR